METIITYKLSQSLDKAFAYRSVIGESLLFILLYEYRLSKFGARYEDSHLFLHSSRRIREEELLNLCPKEDRAKIQDTLFALERIDKKYIRFFNTPYILKRFRKTEATIINTSDFVYSDRGITIHDCFLFANSSRLNDIYINKELLANRTEKYAYGTALVSFSECIKNGINNPNDNTISLIPKYEEEGIHVEPELIVNRDSNYGAIINNVISVGLPDKGVIKNEFYFVGTTDLCASVLSGDMLGTPDKGAIRDEQDFVGTFDNILNISEQQMYGTRDKTISDTDMSISVGTETKGLNAVDDNLLVNTRRKGIASIENERVRTHNKGIFENENSGYVGKTNHGVYSTGNMTAATDEKAIYEDDRALHISKFGVGVDTTATNTMVDHSPRKISVDASGFLLSKNSSSISGYDSFESISKVAKGVFDIDKVCVDKGLSRPVMGGPIEMITKNAKGVAGYNSDTTASKSSKAIRSEEDVALVRSKQFGVFNIDDVCFEKDGYKTYINKDDSAKRINLRDFTYSVGMEFITKGLIGVIGDDSTLPVSKNPYATNNGIDTSEFVTKAYYNAYIDKSNMLYDKLYKDTTISSKHDVLFKKAYKDTGIDRVSEIVNKNYKPTSLTDISEFVTKKYYHADVTDRSEWFIVPYRNFAIERDNLFVGKSPYDTMLNRVSVHVQKSEHDTAINKYVTFDKRFDVQLNKSMFVQRPILKLATVETPTFVDRPYTKDTHIDDHNNFAYVEKTDYARIKDDRIDELQLPPTDFNYSSFASKLFVNGSLDTRYVNRVDDNGNYFINLPIENPIRHFADLAVHYIDLNVGMLTYIIEKAYNIWQSNIFAYSVMASDVALNEILKKLKHNLYIQYPSEKDQEHLHRAIRLFRWYCEMAILNNAEYMLKLEYDDLAVDYANKDLSPIDSICNIVNMEIGSDYTLTYINPTQEASLHFRINRGHECNLVFDLAVDGADCVIIENGTIENYNSEYVKVNKLLQPGENDIVIKFTPTSTTPIVAIVKLAIQKYSIKSYKLSYVGKIGETNPTVNHLISMLSVCGDSIESIQKTVANATPTVQALDQLREYFDLHHQDKLKGKRLTIKR